MPAVLIARAELAVLRAGGIGIEVETAGKAFMLSDWESNYKTFTPLFWKFGDLLNSF